MPVTASPNNDPIWLQFGENSGFEEGTVRRRFWGETKKDNIYENYT